MDASQCHHCLYSHFYILCFKNVVDIMYPICYIRRCKAYCFAYGANRGIPRDKFRLTCLRLGNHVHINSTSYILWNLTARNIGTYPTCLVSKGTLTSLTLPARTVRHILTRDISSSGHGRITNSSCITSARKNRFRQGRLRKHLRKCLRNSTQT